MYTILLVFHTWCGLSANLECMSETCCTGLDGNTGPKKSLQSRYLGTIEQLCRAIFATKAHIDNRKKNKLSNMSPQYGERPTKRLTSFR